MEKIGIRISEGKKRQIEMIEYPTLTSTKKLVQKGIDLVHKHAPLIIHFLSRQRTFSQMHSLPIEVTAPAGMEEEKVVRLLKRWIGGKKYRRVFYVLVEGILLPFAFIAGMLPGPNIFLYGLIILFYFHGKALLTLGKVRFDQMQLTIKHEKDTGEPGISAPPSGAISP